MGLDSGLQIRGRFCGKDTLVYLFIPDSKDVSVGSFVLPKPTLAFGASKEVINNPKGHHLLTYLDHIRLIWGVGMVDSRPSNDDPCTLHVTF